MDLTSLRVGYAPYAKDMNSPGDRRRFCFYAKQRGMRVEQADPSRDYDLVYLSTRADLSAWTRYQGQAKIVFEMIDSYLALPDRQIKNAFRGLAKYASRELSSPVVSYRRAVETMAARSDAVVCSTTEQKEQLTRFCSNTHIILDAHEEVGGQVKADYGRGKTLHLVWEGLGYTVKSFETISGPLEELAKSTDVVLHLITDLSFRRYLGKYISTDTQKRARTIFPRTFVYQWNPYLLSHIATACDLAVIPLDLKDPFSVGKPENKLLLLWRMGMPTLTSASPAYERAMEAAGVEMACRKASEWATKLTEYAADERLREASGQAGYSFVMTQHGLDRLLQRWDGLMASLGTI